MCAERLPHQTRPRPADAGGFGESLRRAREARGLTLAAVAEKTRIAAHHLEALERSDLDALPAGPFARSYIRSYAEVLGIDAGPVLEAHSAKEIRRGVGTAERDERMLQELSHLVGRGDDAGGSLLRAHPRALRVAAAVVLLAAVGTVGWLLVRHRTRERTPTAAARAPAATAVAAPRARSAPPSDTPPATAAPVKASPAASPPSPRPQAARRPPESTAGAARPTAPAGPQAKPPAATIPSDTLQVSAFGVGNDVVDHRLVGRADRFSEGTRVFFWTLVAGGQPRQAVRHVWFEEGRAVMRVDLPVEGPHWRTRSSLVLPAGCAGPWTVEARTPDGRLLARNDFVCERRPR